MRSRFSWLAGLTAAVASVTFASLAFAGGDHASKVRAPRAEAPVAYAASAGTRVTRLQRTFTLQPGAVDGGTGRCPSRAPHAIGGYFGTNDGTRAGDMVAVGSAPFAGSQRKWLVLVKNISNTPLTAFVGTICVR
jgi:hypothetical protein